MEVKDVLVVANTYLSEEETPSSKPEIYANCLHGCLQLGTLTPTPIVSAHQVFIQWWPSDPQAQSHGVCLPISELYMITLRCFEPNTSTPAQDSKSSKGWTSLTLMTQDHRVVPSFWFSDSSESSPRIQGHRETALGLVEVIRAHLSLTEIIKQNPNRQDFMVDRPLITGHRLRSDVSQSLTNLAKDTAVDVLDRFAQVTRYFNGWLNPSLDERPRTSLEGDEPPLKQKDSSKLTADNSSSQEIDWRQLELQRWSEQVWDDTHRQILDARRQTRQQRMNQGRPGFGVSLILSQDLVMAMETQLGQFEFVEETEDANEAYENDMKLGLDQDQLKSEPLSVEEWKLAFNAEGQLQVDELQFRQRIFEVGLKDDATRCLVWPFLMGVFPWNSTLKERQQLLEEMTKHYTRLFERWYSILNGNTPSVGSDRRQFKEWKEVIEDRLHRVEKDVVRTDRSHPFYQFTEKPLLPSSTEQDQPQLRSLADTTTHDHGSTAFLVKEVALYPRIRHLRDLLMTYGMFHVDLGYVQGMSDVLSPLYAILATGWSLLKVQEFSAMETAGPLPVDETQLLALVFACFVEFMLPSANKLGLNRGSHLSANFHGNQSGMRTRLTLITYMLRLLDPDCYRALEEMELEENVPESDIDRVLGTGATGLLWLFRGVLTLFKRELSTLPEKTSSTDTENRIIHSTDYYGQLPRVWERMWSVQSWLPFADIWLTLSIIELYLRPHLLSTPSKHLKTFEDLLTFMNHGSWHQECQADPLVQKWKELYSQWRHRIHHIEKTIQEPLVFDGRPPLALMCVRDRDRFWDVNEDWPCREVTALSERRLEPVELKLALYEALSLLQPISK